MAQSLMAARGLRGLIYAAIAIFAYAMIGAYQPQNAVIDLGELGAVGDGSTINNPYFAAAWAQLASGGEAHIPCGVYKITATPSATIAAGKHAEVAGDGQDCTVIYVSGAIAGPSFNVSSQWASFGFHDLTIVTDQTGGTNCLAVTGSFSNPNSAYAASSSVTNVTFRGFNAYGAATEYCGNGLYENGISNLNLTNLAYQGIASRAGTPISLNGTGTNSTYSVQIGIINLIANNCGTAVSYGSWVQGVFLVDANITGCNNGPVVASSPSGTLSGLSVVNSQINTFACAICINDAVFNNAQIMNNQIIVEANSVGIKVQGTNWITSANEIDGVGSPTSQGLVVGSTFGNGGSASGDHIIGMASAIQVGALSQSTVKIDAMHLSNNTTDYSINSASRGTIITDTQPRNYSTVPACNAATALSSYEIVDSPSIVFNATLTAGGGNNFVGMKCDGTRNYVD